METTTLPATTRAAVYRGAGRIEFEDVVLPPLGPGELLVRITACGICSSETMRWYADGKAPFVLGHEPVGIIEACGAGAAPLRPWEKTFAPGERVFVHHHAPCMACRSCARGDYVQCAAWRAAALRPGGMAQFAIAAPESVRADVLRLPDGVDDDRATLVEPLATVVKSVRRSRMRPGDRVLVIGLGVMGMLHALLARRRGAELVLGADRIASRLARAPALGFDRALNVDERALADQVREWTRGEGADVVIVGPGSIAAMDEAAACVAPGGTIMLFTPPRPGERWPIDVHDLFFKDVSIVTSYSAGPDDTREALGMLASGLDVEPLFTHRFGFGHVAEAYATLAAADQALKVIVYPGKP